ncbi:MAG TPA: hypothetical protein VHJ77_14700 [Vicinamibacterales bacterium]|jgi:hypothetical protein|nr:hypothetical protein [Vicinamibacterales bacterium]
MADLRTRADWKTEDQYWRENYKRRPYFETDRDYDYYSPAYRFGYDASERYADRKWEEVEPDLQRDWDRYEHRGQSTWQQIKNAVRDAWDRMVGNR